MKSKNTAVRIATFLASPLVLLCFIAVPIIAGGAYFLTTPVHGAAVSPAHSSSTASSDPLAVTRRNLAQTSLPLGILSGGLSQLSDGGKKLDDGARQLSTGLDSARTGSTQLADGMTKLNDGVDQLGNGSTAVSNGVDQLVEALTGVGAVQGQLAMILQQSIDSVSAIKDPAAQDAANQLRSVQNLMNTQGVGANVLDQLQNLKTGANKIAYTLDNPTSSFVTGMAAANTGAGQLRDGIVKLDDGSKQLVDGTTQIVDGTGPVTGIVTSLKTNVDNASRGLPAREQITTGTTSPADGSGVTTTVFVRPATSIAPYFVGALLLVGAVCIVVSRRIRSKRAVLATRFPVLPTLALAIAGFVALYVVQPAENRGPSTWIALFILLSAAALIGTARAINAVCGPRFGRIVNAGVVVVQVGICGLSAADSSDFGWNTFTPLGYVAIGIERLGAGDVGRELAVSVIVLVAVLVTSVLVVHTTRRQRETPRSYVSPFAVFPVDELEPATQ